MNYQEFIQSIKDSRPNKYFEYSERHHIIPRCLGGTDDEENLIYLNYEEHFIAHNLLHEENPEDKNLLYAVIVMSRNGELHKEEYAHLKREFADSQRGNKHYEGKVHSDEWKRACSEWMKGRQQCINKIWINKDSHTLMVDPLDLNAYIADGWSLGRGEFHSDQTKEFCRVAASGRIWINDGVNSKMIYDTEEIPGGWRRGRLMRRDKKGRIVKFNE